MRVYSPNNQTHTFICLFEISSEVSHRHKSKLQVKISPPQLGFLPQIPISANNATIHWISQVISLIFSLLFPIPQTQAFC